MVSASMTVQHAKWLEHARELDWRRPVASLNVLLTSTCWRNDHNGFSPSGPRTDRRRCCRSGATVSRIYLPPDANCLLSVADHCFRSRNYVNLIVIDKQPQLQYLDVERRAHHCSQGAGVWEWASQRTATTPTSCWRAPVTSRRWRRWPPRGCCAAHVPDLRVRVVNVVDLMRLFPANDHPHGMDALEFNDLFTPDRDVVFAFHGYARARCTSWSTVTATRDRFHVRGVPRGGHHDDAVRHGRAEQGQPLPPVQAGDPPSPPPSRRRRRARAALRRDARASTGSTSTSTSRTFPRSATGPGPTERGTGARPLPQRGLVDAEGGGLRGRGRGSRPRAHRRAARGTCRRASGACPARRTFGRRRCLR